MAAAKSPVMPPSSSGSPDDQRHRRANGARVLSLNEPALRSVMESHSQAAAILLFNLCRMLATRVAARTGQN
jgi:hypothetical protein